MTIKEAIAKFKERVESHSDYPALQERIKKLKAEAKASDATEKEGA